MPWHIRDFSMLCGAKFESHLGKCTENNKRNRPKLGRTARKFLLCGITILFKIYFSYGFGSWEVNREDVTVITHLACWEVLLFLASKVAILALPLYGLDSCRRKILRSDGWKFRKPRNPMRKGPVRRVFPQLLQVLSLSRFYNLNN